MSALVHTYATPKTLELFHCEERPARFRRGQNNFHFSKCGWVLGFDGMSIRLRDT